MFSMRSAPLSSKKSGEIRAEPIKWFPPKAEVTGSNPVECANYFRDGLTSRVPAQKGWVGDASRLKASSKYPLWFCKQREAGPFGSASCGAQAPMQPPRHRIVISAHLST